jgi:uridine kinase
VRPPIESVSRIHERIRAVARPVERVLVAIGGCSLSGKSTLATALRKRLIAGGVNAEVLGADHWIVDVRERRPDGGVLDRFDGSAFVDAVDAILSGATVHPPVYDRVLRQRTAPRAPEGVRLHDGVLIAEGVIALLLTPLCERAAVRIYVEAPDDVRRRRLLEFYCGTKGLSLDAAGLLLAGRELEEVPLVSASAAVADVLYAGNDNDTF